MSYHFPVLTSEILNLTKEHISLQKEWLFIDATLGDGGHTLALLQQFPKARIIGIDRDAEMLARAESRLRANRISLEYKKLTALETDFPTISARTSVTLVHSSFHTLPKLLYKQQPKLILLDLGVSLYHLKQAKRGFSYTDENLDMRFDSSSQITAQQLINYSSPRELTRILQEYGEEPYAHRLAHAIVKERPFYSAIQLSHTICRNLPATAKRHKRIHPATRSFQALRIATNQELHLLDLGLQQLPHLLAPGGLLAIISFHSLEDRRVKQCFRQLGYWKGKKQAATSPFLILTRRPISPSQAEISANSPSRSARLRVLLKQNL